MKKNIVILLLLLTALLTGALVRSKAIPYFSKAQTSTKFPQLKISDTDKCKFVNNIAVSLYESIICGTNFYCFSMGDQLNLYTSYGQRLKLLDSYQISPPGTDPGLTNNRFTKLKYFQKDGVDYLYALSMITQTDNSRRRQTKLNLFQINGGRLKLVNTLPIDVGGLDTYTVDADNSLLIVSLNRYGGEYFWTHFIFDIKKPESPLLLSHVVGNTTMVYANFAYNNKTLLVHHNRDEFIDIINLDKPNLPKLKSVAIDEGFAIIGFDKNRQKLILRDVRNFFGLYGQIYHVDTPASDKLDINKAEKLPVIARGDLTITQNGLYVFKGYDDDQSLVFFDPGNNWQKTAIPKSEITNSRVFEFKTTVSGNTLLIKGSNGIGQIDLSEQPLHSSLNEYQSFKFYPVPQILNHDYIATRDALIGVEAYGFKDVSDYLFISPITASSAELPEKAVIIPLEENLDETKLLELPNNQLVFGRILKNEIKFTYFSTKDNNLTPAFKTIQESTLSMSVDPDSDNRGAILDAGATDKTSFFLVEDPYRLITLTNPPSTPKLTVTMLGSKSNEFYLQPDPKFAVLDSDTVFLLSYSLIGYPTIWQVTDTSGRRPKLSKILIDFSQIHNDSSWHDYGLLDSFDTNDPKLVIEDQAFTEERKGNVTQRIYKSRHFFAFAQSGKIMPIANVSDEVTAQSLKKSHQMMFELKETNQVVVVSPMSDSGSPWQNTLPKTDKRCTIPLIGRALPRQVSDDFVTIFNSDYIFGEYTPEEVHPFDNTSRSLYKFESIRKGNGD